MPAAEVVVGYLVITPDGYQCRLGPDRGRAEAYAAMQHAQVIEPMFVRRSTEVNHEPDKPASHDLDPGADLRAHMVGAGADPDP